MLAPTLAHEIGHLLLTGQGHSSSGIMRAHWRREDYERAPRGAFNFTAGRPNRFAPRSESGFKNEVQAKMFAQLPRNRSAWMAGA